jgi:transcriptional regulator with XRE-family HTH domain
MSTTKITLPTSVRWKSLALQMLAAGYSLSPSTEGLDRFAEEIGVRPRSVVGYLSGEFAPTTERLRRIAEVLSGCKPGFEAWRVMMSQLVIDQPATRRSQRLYSRLD